MYLQMIPQMRCTSAPANHFFANMSGTKRAQVVGLAAEGHSIAEIVRKTGFHRSFVKRWYRRESTQDRPRSGRPTKLTANTMGKVRGLMKVWSGRILTAATKDHLTCVKGKKDRSVRRVAALLRERYGIHLSNASVFRAARAAGLKSYLRPTKPFLTDAHKLRRLAFVRKYRRLNWRQVLFSDEKTFQLFGHPHNRYIWAPEASDVPAQATVKHPPKLHVWAGMSYYGKTELYMFTGNMDAEFYEGILKERLLPDAARMFGGRPWVFQQDGDPKHNSARVQAWLRDNVRFLAKGDWPANSPDLNPMENLWAYLQQRVYAREPRTLAGLQQVIQQEWETIPIEKLQRLVNSMPRRFAAVQYKQGGPTSY